MPAKSWPWIPLTGEVRLMCIFSNYRPAFLRDVGNFVGTDCAANFFLLVSRRRLQVQYRRQLCHPRALFQATKRLRTKRFASSLWHFPNASEFNSLYHFHTDVIMQRPAIFVNAASTHWFSPSFPPHTIANRPPGKIGHGRADRTLGCQRWH